MNTRTQVIEQAGLWHRFCARIIDLILFELLVKLFLLWLNSPPSHAADILYIRFILFIWVFVETMLLITLGTTPGKWLLNIELKSINGDKISFSQAIKRSAGVWFYGLGTGQPILSLIAGIMVVLDANKYATIWDERGNFSLTTKTQNKVKGYVGAFIITALALGVIFLKINKVVQ